MIVYADFVTRLRGVPGTGSHGQPIIDWSNPDEAEFDAAVMDPTSNEDVQRAQRVEAQYIVQLGDATADVVPTDRIVWDGDTYEIVSAIGKLAMKGHVRALKFLIKRWTGA